MSRRAVPRLAAPYRVEDGSGVARQSGLRRARRASKPRAGLCARGGWSRRTDVLSVCQRALASAHISRLPSRAWRAPNVLDGIDPRRKMTQQKHLSYDVADFSSGCFDRFGVI